MFNRNISNCNKSFCLHLRYFTKWIKQYLDHLGWMKESLGQFQFQKSLTSKPKSNTECTIKPSIELNRHTWLFYSVSIVKIPFKDLNKGHNKEKERIKLSSRVLSSNQRQPVAVLLYSCYLRPAYFDFVCKLHWSKRSQVSYSSLYFQGNGLTMCSWVRNWGSQQ